MTNPPTVTPASNVRAEMARRGITQQQMAEYLGKTQSAVSKRLRGVVPFDVTEIVQIATLFGCPVERLFEGVAAAEAAS